MTFLLTLFHCRHAGRLALPLFLLVLFGSGTGGRAEPAPSDTAPVAAAVAVDWRAAVGRTTAATFGVNDEMCTSPAQGSGNAAYARNLADMGARFYRLHCGSLTDDWSDAATHQWNVKAIAAEYHAPYLRGATIIQNIPGPPAWLRRKDGTVSDPAAYAAYCAGLVAIVNGRLGQHVVYWEPLNEWEGRYKGRWAEACAVYNQCAIAMKRQDPRIKVGPAFEWPNQDGIVQPFLQACAANTDFLAYHSYYSSGPTESTDAWMVKANAMANDVTNTRKSIRQYGQGRPLQIMLDEYNLDGNWNDSETRQHTHIGAVYFASLLTQDAYAGIDACALWSAKEGTYGLTDMGDRRRTPFSLFQWANHNLIGVLVKTASTHPKVRAMAVRTPKARAMMVINQASGPATVRLALGFPARTVTVWTLTAGGMSAARAMPASRLSSWTLAPCSLLFVRAAFP